MTEQIATPEITPEMIAAYQKQQEDAEKQRRHAVLRELAALAQERGYQLIAIPQFTDDGRIAATWGVRQIEG